VPGILFSVAAVAGILSLEAVVVVPLSSDSFLSSEAVVVVPLSFDSLLSSEAVVVVPLSSDILLFSPVEEEKEEAFPLFYDSSPFSASEVALGLSVVDTLEEEEEKMGHRTAPVGRLRNLLLLPRSYDPVPSPPRGLAAAGLDSNSIRRRRRCRYRYRFRRSRRSPIDEDSE